MCEQQQHQQQQHQQWAQQQYHQQHQAQPQHQKSSHHHHHHQQQHHQQQQQHQHQQGFHHKQPRNGQQKNSAAGPRQNKSSGSSPLSPVKRSAAIAFGNEDQGDLDKNKNADGEAATEDHGVSEGNNPHKRKRRPNRRRPRGRRGGQGGQSNANNTQQQQHSGGQNMTPTPKDDSTDSKQVNSTTSEISQTSVVSPSSAAFSNISIESKQSNTVEDPTTLKGPAGANADSVVKGEQAEGTVRDQTNGNKSQNAKSAKLSSNNNTSSSNNNKNGGPKDRPTKRRKKEKDPLEELHPKYLAAQRVGTTPEEIARWRAERRRNYPTQANISRREDEAKAAGAIQPSTITASSVKDAETTSQVSTSNDAVPSGQNDATKQIAATTKFSNTDHNNAAGENNRKQSDKRGGASSGPRGEPRPQRLCNRFMATGKCPVAKCRFSHDPQRRTEALIAKRKRAEKQQFLRATARPGGQDSLLRKLLRADIAKERAVILHCIHHVLQRAAEEASNAPVPRLTSTEN
mmetsp:Transcript_2904/g.5173  ORF Transcript_2904/g.5173 Transcript_2904/m.5173 type:complete len:516 (+) Transcript_2904:489-2036(+)